LGNTVIAASAGTRQAQQEVVIEHSLALHMAIINVTMSSSYASGGDACDFQNALGLLNRANPVFVIVAPSAGYVAEWDSVNKKMLVYRQSAATSALTEPTGVNLSAVTFKCLVFHP
jgi:hypothetical protein